MKRTIIALLVCISCSFNPDLVKVEVLFPELNPSYVLSETDMWKIEYFKDERLYSVYFPLKKESFTLFFPLSCNTVIYAEIISISSSGIPPICPSGVIASVFPEQEIQLNNAYGSLAQKFLQLQSEGFCLDVLNLDKLKDVLDSIPPTYLPFLDWDSIIEKISTKDISKNDFSFKVLDSVYLPLDYNSWIPAESILLSVLKEEGGETLFSHPLPGEYLFIHNQQPLSFAYLEILENEQVILLSKR